MSAFNAGSIFGSLKMDISDYASGMIEAEGIMQAFGPMVAEFMENPLLGAISIAREAAHALLELTTETLNEGRAMDLAAQKAGFTVEEFSKLSWAAKEVNIDMGQLGVGLRMMQLHATDAANGSKEAQDAFAHVGVSAAFLNEHLDNNQAIFKKVLEGIDRLPTQAERTAAAIHLLGRSGGELVPLLAMGSNAIDEIGRKAEQYGAVENAESVAVAAAWNKTVNELMMAWEAMKKIFAETVAGPLQAELRQLLTWIQGHMPEIKQHIETVASAFITAVSIVGPLILFLIEHLDKLVLVLGAAGLVKVAASAVESLQLLGAAYVAITARIAAATTAQMEFNAASVARGAGVGGAIGVGIGAIGGGSTEELIGGGIGGILGMILGNLILPGIGGYFGAAAGGFAGQQFGQGIHNHYHVQTHFDPHEAASQFAAQVEPQIRAAYNAQTQQTAAMATQRVSQVMGAQRRRH